MQLFFHVPGMKNKRRMNVGTQNMWHYFSPFLSPTLTHTHTQISYEKTPLFQQITSRRGRLPRKLLFYYFLILNSSNTQPTSVRIIIFLPVFLLIITRNCQNRNWERKKMEELDIDLLLLARTQRQSQTKYRIFQQHRTCLSVYQEIRQRERETAKTEPGSDLNREIS